MTRAGRDVDGGVPSESLRVLLVVNSFASSVTARNTVVVHRRLSRGHDVELVETNRRGHATRFAYDAARRGLDVVVGFGGDGTLNEVATGIAGSETALGVLPGGSTNVFARTIGMPNDPVEAVELLAGGIDAGDFRPIGLGKVISKPVLFSLSNAWAKFRQVDTLRSHDGAEKEF